MNINFIGEKKWNFNFMIPKNIPSSVDYKNGKVIILFIKI